MSTAFFWRERYIRKYTHRCVRLAMSPCHSPRQILQIKIEYIRLQEIAISCNLKQHTVESDLNKIWHSFYIPMRHQASYFHTLLIIEKGGGKGCAHDTCKVLMGSKMWENDKKFYFPFWTHKHLTCIVCAPFSAPLFYNEQTVKIWCLRSHRNVKLMSYLI